MNKLTQIQWLLGVLIVLQCGGVVAASGSESRKMWVAEFHQVPSRSVLGALQNQGLQISKLTPYRSAYFDRVYRIQGSEAAALALQTNASIKNLEEVSQLEEFSADPLLHEQWALDNKGQQVREEVTDIKSSFRSGKIGEDLGWRAVQPGLDRSMRRDAVVAVLDSGVDYDHEDLAEKIFLNETECFKGEIPLGNAKDDKDGNGYAGDCKGINLTTNSPAQKNRPLDTWGHGTHVASLIAAKGGNGLGIAGLSDRIKILPVKITSENDRSIRVALSDRVAEAILYAVSRRVDVINMSVGWPRGLSAKHVEEAIKEATRQGVLVVAAAGNNSHSVPIFPCAYSDVICVGASRNDGAPAKFTNYGAHVDVIAPGDYILGAFPMTLIPTYPVPGYELKSGTSQAAPYVAALLAMAKAIEPNAKSSEVLAKVLQSAKTVQGDKQVYFNNGVIDLRKFQKQSAPNFVRWLYKETAVLGLDRRGRLSLPITLQNLSPSTKTVNVRIKSAIPGVNLSDKKTIRLGAWQKQSVNFSGSVPDQKIESQFKFELEIDGVIRHGEALLARKLGEVSGSSAIVQNSEKETQLFTMPSLDNEVKGLHYFNLSREANGDGLILKAWRREARQISKIGEVSLPGLVTPLGAFEMDANLDGRRDITVLGLRKEMIESNGKTSEQFRLSIFYFDGDLRPLIPGQARIDLHGENIFNYASFANHRKTRWVPQYFQNFGYLRTPSIVESGMSPKEDLSDLDRRAQRNDTVPHLYFLQPEGSKAGDYNLRTRIVDSAAMQAQVRSQLDLRHYDAVTPQWAPLAFNEERDGAYIFRAGVLEASKVLALKLTPQGANWSVLNWRSPYLNYEPHLATNVQNPLHPRSVLFGMVAPNRGHLVVLDPAGRSVQESLVLDLPDEWEDIIRPLYFSINGEEMIAVLESGLSMYGFIFRNGRLQTVHQRRIVRSTFNGNIASQVFLPIRTKSGKTALYVDSTQVYANNVFLWQLDSRNGFHAPLETSYTLPDNCRALNPVQWDKTKSHNVSFLCKTSHGLELRFLD